LPHDHLPAFYPLCAGEMQTIGKTVIQNTLLGPWYSAIIDFQLNPEPWVRLNVFEMMIHNFLETSMHSTNQDQ
jgi:hypothetical protein